MNANDANDEVQTIVNSRGEFGMSVLNFLTRPGEIAETTYGRVAGCTLCCNTIALVELANLHKTWQNTNELTTPCVAARKRKREKVREPGCMTYFTL